MCLAEELSFVKYFAVTALSCGVESRGSEVVCDQWRRSDVHRLQRLVDIHPESGNLGVIIPGIGKCGGTASARVCDIVAREKKAA